MQSSTTQLTSSTFLPRPIKFNSLEDFVLGSGEYSNQINQYNANSHIPLPVPVHTATSKPFKFTSMPHHYNNSNQQKRLTWFDKYNTTKLKLSDVNPKHLQELSKNLVIAEQDVGVGFGYRSGNNINKNKKRMSATGITTTNMSQKISNNQMAKTTKTHQHQYHPQSSTFIQQQQQQSQSQTTKQAAKTSQGFHNPNTIKKSKQYEQNQLLFNFKQIAQDKKAKKKEFLQGIEEKLNRIEQQTRQLQDLQFEEQIQLRQVGRMHEQLGKQLAMNALAGKVSSKTFQQLSNTKSKSNKHNKNEKNIESDGNVNDNDDDAEDLKYMDYDDDSNQEEDFNEYEEEEENNGGGSEVEPVRSLNAEMSPLQINYVLQGHYGQNERLLDQITRVKSKSRSGSRDLNNNTRSVFSPGKTQQQLLAKTSGSGYGSGSGLKSAQRTGKPVSNHATTPKQFSKTTTAMPTTNQYDGLSPKQRARRNPLTVSKHQHTAAMAVTTVTSNKFPPRINNNNNNRKR